MASSDRPKHLAVSTHELVANLVQPLITDENPVDVRDLLGSTRKYVLPILNQLDAEGVTRRRGDDRIPGPASGLG